MIKQKQRIIATVNNCSAVYKQMKRKHDLLVTELTIENKILRATYTYELRPRKKGERSAQEI